MKAKLSGNYHCRPVTIDDLSAMADMFNAHSQWVEGINHCEIDELRSEWGEPEFNLTTDTMAVFTEDNQPAGYIELFALKPYVRLYSWASVHPDHMNRGIGSFLIDWLIERARNSIAMAPDDARVVLEQFINSRLETAADLLPKYGFQLVRHAYNMRIDFTQPPEAPVVPEGITIRSIANDDEEREAIRAAYDSFRDHWGWVERPFDDYYERWKYFLEHNKDYDPSLYFIALDGTEIAGVSLCYPKVPEDSEMGWVGTLGVRRPWRKHGLGLALLRHSFNEFYRQGKPRAGLGVDASSLTGATRLYERAGMYVYRKHNQYQLELRPGIDLTTQSVEE